MIKHTQTMSTNCLSVFDLFVGLALKRLNWLWKSKFMTISFRGRVNVKYFMQTKVLRFYKDTAKDFSLLLLKITTKSTNFPLSKKKKTQKQPSRCVLRKRCSENMLQIYSKFTGERPCQSVISINLQRNFIKITLRHVILP